jgi:hypothetical protein
MVRGHHLVYYVPHFHRSLWSSPTSPVGWTENLLWSQITLPYIVSNLQSIRYLPITVLHWLQFSIKLQKASTLLLLYICIQSSELNSRRTTPNLQLLTTTPSMVIPIFWFHLAIVYCAATWKSLVLVDFCQWKLKWRDGHRTLWAMMPSNWRESFLPPSIVSP